MAPDYAECDFAVPNGHSGPVAHSVDYSAGIASKMIISVIFSRNDAISMENGNFPYLFFLNFIFSLFQSMC